MPDHHAETIRVDDLAQLSGMSVSAFHRNFQAVTAMSPIQFQKQIRLQQARLLLVTHPDNVAGAGYAVGYDSPSQFSREYRRQFGAPPSLDAYAKQPVCAQSGYCPDIAAGSLARIPPSAHPIRHHSTARTHARSAKSAS